MSRCLCDQESSGTIMTVGTRGLYRHNKTSLLVWTDDNTPVDDQVGIIKRLVTSFDDTKSGDGDCALILYATKYSNNVVSDEKFVTQHHACGAHMLRQFMADESNIVVYYHQSQLVILRKPLVNYEECLIWLTTEKVRCNECLMGKIGKQESVGLILWVQPPWWINVECYQCWRYKISRMA